MINAPLEREHVCHVCNTHFMIRSVVDSKQKGRFDNATPSECPMCTAPIRWVLPRTQGDAKGIILTHYGVPEYCKEFGSAQQYLARYCRTTEDVDVFVDLIEHLDFEDWDALERMLNQGHKMTRAQRNEDKGRKLAWEEAKAGRLTPSIRVVAQAVKDALIAERQRCLTIMEARNPSHVTDGHLHRQSDVAAVVQVREVQSAALAFWLRYLEPSNAPKRPYMMALLKPHPEDFARVFMPPAVQQMRAFYERVWAGQPIIQPKSSQNTVRISIARAEEFALSTIQTGAFPGGYKKIALLLRPEVLWIAWKFTREGAERGLSFDGLVWLDDHWAWFPKPWHALTE